MDITIICYYNRDGKAFGEILNFLRTGKLLLSSSTSLELLLEEAEYWGCSKLIETIKWPSALFEGGNLTTPQQQRQIVDWIIGLDGAKNERWKVIALTNVPI